MVSTSAIILDGAEVCTVRIGQYVTVTFSGNIKSNEEVVSSLYNDGAVKAGILSLIKMCRSLFDTYEVNLYAMTRYNCVNRKLELRLDPYVHARIYGGCIVRDDINDGDVYRIRQELAETRGQTSL